MVHFHIMFKYYKMTRGSKRKIQPKLNILCGSGLHDHRQSTGGYALLDLHGLHNLNSIYGGERDSRGLKGKR
jgi:hypothetical protein